ncbi:unnamed protein product, partial [Didymodactylos carnosus]
MQTRKIQCIPDYYQYLSGQKQLPLQLQQHQRPPDPTNVKRNNNNDNKLAQIKTICQRIIISKINVNRKNTADQICENEQIADKLFSYIQRNFK